MLLLPAEFSSAKFIALFFNVLKLSGSGIWTAILIRYFDHPGGNVSGTFDYSVSPGPSF